MGSQGWRGRRLTQRQQQVGSLATRHKDGAAQEWKREGGARPGSWAGRDGGEEGGGGLGGETVMLYTGTGQGRPCTRNGTGSGRAHLECEYGPRQTTVHGIDMVK